MGVKMISRNEMPHEAIYFANNQEIMSSEDYASTKDGTEKENHTKILTMIKNENYKHKLLHTTKCKPFTISSSIL